MKLIVLGLFTILITVGGLFFYPVAKAEYDLYLLDHNGLKFQIAAIENKERQLTPVDTQFGIVINKIAANTKVQEFDVVNDNLSLEFLLQNGLAHLSNSPVPGDDGNVVIVAQTSGDWYKYTRENPEFYLIYKLEPKDIIQVYYGGQRFDYSVIKKFQIEETQLRFYTSASDQKLLTIISGWPPGLTIFRDVVQAKLVE